MKIAPLLMTCAALSAVSGGIVARLVAPKVSAAEGAKATSPDLEQRIGDLESSRQDLLSQVQNLKDRLQNPLSVPEPDRQSLGMSDQELDSLALKLQERMLNLEDAPGQQDPSAPELDSQFDLMAVAEELMDESLSSRDKDAIWDALRKSGNIEAMVDWFRERAEANPNDPDAQASLGMAYLQQLFGAQDMMSQGRLANSADSSFDRALELDGQHWNARFQKAVSYSFWPPALGKQSAAIQEFETLIQQQKGQTLAPEFAQSYLFLGNMHQQMGNMDEALATWNEGLLNHPGNAELQAQIDSASGQ